MKSTGTYDGQRAYGRESGPCKAGIGLGGDFAQVIQPVHIRRGNGESRRCNSPSPSGFTEGSGSSACIFRLRKSSAR